MSTGHRISITVSSALALGIATFVYHSGVSHLGPELWRTGVFVPYSIAIAGVFFVDRWWALVWPSTSVAVAWWARAAHDNPGPWAVDPGVPAFIWPLVVFQTIAPTLGLLLIGLVARRLWDRFRGSVLPAASLKGGGR